MDSERRVHPDCINASNPYHECVECCFQKIAEPKARLEKQGRDLISNLPDEVLGKILSLLWTNRAACTSVLSKRWRNLLALVDNLDLHDASGNHRYFCDFVDNTLALLSNVKRFSLDCDFYDEYEPSRVDSWIRTVMEHGFLELHLNTAGMHAIDTKFFTSSTLVKLTIWDGFYPDGDGDTLPRGAVLFPALKTLTLVAVCFLDTDMYRDFIHACPVLEELFLHYEADHNPPAWPGFVSSPSIKRLTIYHNWPNHREEAHESCLFVTPSLEYLEYSSYVAKQYQVELASLVEARLDLRSWEQPTNESDEDESDESDSDRDSVDVFGDVTDLVAGISNVKTLHLSSDSLEVFYLSCATMPVFRNLLNLSFESDKEIGWQVVPLLLNNSPNLETLAIKGLVHQVTNRCGDACSCIPKRKRKKKKTMIMEKRVCCLSTCQVKVLHISGYRGTCREMKLMRHFLANLKRLETVKVGVEVNHHQQDKDATDRYLRVTDTLMKLPRVSSNSRIHFF